MIKAVLIAFLGVCPTEDSNNCVWDEDQSGNLTGVSFVALEEPMTGVVLLHYFGLGVTEVLLP